MFKSFYKIQHSLIYSDMGVYDNVFSNVHNKPKQTDTDISYNSRQKNRKTANVFTTNLLVAFITLFSLRYTNASKRTAHTSSIVNFNNNLSFIVSFFFLPRRKKNVIFLRAPYKNKLARLNILNLEYTFILSIRTNPTSTAIKLTNLIDYFSKFNVSSTKLKHSKTTVSVHYSQAPNFNISSFVSLV